MFPFDQMSGDNTAIPNQYVVRVYRSASVFGAPMNGDIVTFTDHRNHENNQDLPNPRYLALHAAIAGVIHMSDAAEYLENILGGAENIHVLAGDGSTELTSLFMVHSARRCSVLCPAVSEISGISNCPHTCDREN